MTAPDGHDCDGFGGSLGLDGDLAVIGAGNFDYGADGDYDNGAFYVFRRNAASGAWDLEHMLHGEENTSLGAKIAVGGGRFVVSSIPDILHVYERDGSDTWVETATLIPMYEDAPDDWIGVRLGDDRIVVWGSHIHVWDLVDGEWISSMVDPDLVSGPVWSTSSLSLEGDRIALGKESHVQILEQDETGEWVPAAELWPSGPAPGQFGYSVALRGNRLLAGDPWADGNTGAGVIFFTPDGGETWLEETRLLSIAAEMGGEVGSAVALGEDFAILGAPKTEVPNWHGAYGRAFVHHFIDGAWDGGSAYTAHSFVDEIDLLEPSSPEDPMLSSGFGHNMATDGERLIVTAEFSRYVGNEELVGSAHIFHLDDLGEWGEEARVQVGSPPFYDNSNYDGSIHHTPVDIDGEFVAIGRLRGNHWETDDPVVDMYAFDAATETWNLEFTIEQPSGYLCCFGTYSLSLDGSRVAIAGGVPVQAGEPKPIFIFERDPATQDWIYDETVLLLTGNHTANNLHLDGDRLIVAGYSHGYSNPKGKVWVFERVGDGPYEFVAHWRRPDYTASSDRFGSDGFDVLGDRIAVSDTLGGTDNVNGNPSGEVFIYDRNGDSGEWELTATLW